MKRLWYLVFVTALLINASFVNPRGKGFRMHTIVIDPGHGGHDSGCLGGSAKEKNIALTIALKMGKMIEEKFPDINVIYTRKTDVFIPLHERAEIANRNRADLFICIHCNSGGKAAFGVETYVMGLHKSEDNLNVAKRENSSILLEENYKKQYDGFDPNSPEANIIFSLYQNEFMNQSLSFASRVQSQVDEFAGRYNRGVKQAGFLVLYRTAMPSVLVETGFLTNETEEKYMMTDKGQTTIANCIFRAFKEYKLDIEDSGEGEPNPPKSKEIKTEKEVVKEVVKPDAPPVKEVQILIDTIGANDTKTIAPIDSSPVADLKIKNADGMYAHVDAQENKGKKDTLSTKNKTVPVKTIKLTTSVKDTVKKNEFDHSSVLDKPVETKPKIKKPTADNSKKLTQSKVYFTVQIAASTDAAKDLPKYLHIQDIHSVKSDDGFVRFVAGNFTVLEDARKRMAQLKNGGYKDAFITAYDGNKRITVNEAVELLK